MTLRQTLEAKFQQQLLGPADIEAIMKIVTASENNTDMTGRWDDPVSGYQEEFLNLLWNIGKREAIVWLQANRPRHIALQALTWQPVQPAPLGKLKPVKDRNG